VIVEATLEKRNGPRCLGFPGSGGLPVAALARRLLAGEPGLLQAISVAREHFSKSLKGQERTLVMATTLSDPLAPQALLPRAVAVPGVFYNAASSFLRGPALAPRRIRDVFNILWNIGDPGMGADVVE
jgi:hypothetical protein